MEEPAIHSSYLQPGSWPPWDTSRKYRSLLVNCLIFHNVSFLRLGVQLLCCLVQSHLLNKGTRMLREDNEDTKNCLAWEKKKTSRELSSHGSVGWAITEGVLEGEGTVMSH